jgi:molecular chaperone GrpE
MTERKSKQHKEAPTAPQVEPQPEEEVVSSVRSDAPTAVEAAAAEKAAMAADCAALQAKLDETEAKAKEYFDGWQRERADFSNYKRRVDRDQAALSQNIAGGVIRKYLLVLDDMDRAMKLRPTEGEVSAWADGIELIYRKLQNILEAEGIKRIPAESEAFDPMRHEAISFEESHEHASGEIIGVVQEGYTLGDRVLRPARVRVAR